MNDLDTLRREVREDVEYLDKGGTARVAKGSWSRIRAELLRLVDENAWLLAANRDCIVHLETIRAELAALRKRIADAPIGYWSPVQDDELCAMAVNEIGPCPSDRIVHLLVDDA
jgi:hypothetical protein